MHNTSFFRTKLGHASLASVAAMVAMIALTNQMSLGVSDANIAQPNAASPIAVELA